MKKADDFKIGFLVILALAGLLTLTLKVGNFTLGKAGYKLKVAFIDSGAIEENAVVRLSGVEVGKVEDVQIVYGKDGTRVVLTLWLNDGARVRQDSQVFVTTLGLMGEKYVELTAGSADSPFLKPNSTIIGREPFNPQKFVEKGEQIAENLDQAITNVRTLTQGVNKIIVVHREDLDKMLKNLVESTENLKDFTEDIKWHPWKLIRKSKAKKPKLDKKIEGMKNEE